MRFEESKIPVWAVVFRREYGFHGTVSESQPQSIRGPMISQSKRNSTSIDLSQLSIDGAALVR